MLSSRLPPPVVLALTQFFVEGSALLRNLILARIIGVEQMGYAVAIALGIRVLEVFGEFGLERWLVQVRSNDLDRARGTVHLLQMVKACLLMVAAMLVASPLMNVIQPELDPIILVFASVSIFIRGFINCDYRVRQRDRDFVGTLQVDGGSNAIAVFAIVPIAIFTQDYSAFALASIVQATALCLLSHAVAKQPMSVDLHTETIGKALRFGFPIACNAALMFLALQGDRLLVAIHFEPQTLAVFALAAQLALLPAIAGARFILTFDLPRFSRLDGRTSERQKLFRDRMLAVTCMAITLAAGLAVIGNTVIEFLYGDDFVADPTVLALLAITAGTRLVRAVPNTALMAAGRTHILFACNLPRIVALAVALVAISNGGGLAMVVGIGALSEAISLGIGIIATTEIYRERSRIHPSPLGSS